MRKLRVLIKQLKKDKFYLIVKYRISGDNFMLTYTYISKGIFGLVEKPKPTIQQERDAIVKVTLASICSSDLHIKHGSVPRAV